MKLFFSIWNVKAGGYEKIEKYANLVQETSRKILLGAKTST